MCVSPQGTCVARLAVPSGLSPVPCVCPPREPVWRGWRCPAGCHPCHVCVPPGNLCGEAGGAQRAVEDAFLRRFLYGTFPGLLADEVVLKRRGNLLVICALLGRALPPYKLYFLLGYAETLLGHFYKCPVRLELQTVPARVPYKYL
ncbi:PREDICTED: 28S ribosomal protein S24, mitochondrial [Ficedula albicollis]|uniref:28S ribosomal protein S24, mitochondrial n=1 Tax=Ficedula albicollis TaxID=59894 RepID=UPI0007AD791E|nr:PREDICTED: 28S ribosomal protein S24, mitochondrial [Ficedula albicollis]